MAEAPRTSAQIARDFVERHPGGWSQDDWNALLEEAERNGVEPTPQVQYWLHWLVESLQEVRQRFSDYSDLVNVCVEFVDQHEGRYTHSDWYGLKQHLASEGFDVSRDDIVKQVGDLVKWLAGFYAKIDPADFPALLELAAKFVERHKGRLDEAPWQVLMMDLQRIFTNVHEIEEDVGKVVESLQELYLRMLRQTLDVFAEETAKFVVQHHGLLDDSVLADFRQDVRQKGYELSKSAEKQVRGMLESASNLYLAAANTEGMEKKLSGLLRVLVNFMTQTDFDWKDQDWERLTADLHQTYAEFADENLRYVGDLMEATREASYRQVAEFAELGTYLYAMPFLLTAPVGGDAFESLSRRVEKFREVGPAHMPIETLGLKMSK